MPKIKKKKTSKKIIKKKIFNESLIPKNFSELEIEEIKELPKQVREYIFCKLYVFTGSATEAAVGAGYSEKTARSAGWRLLTKPDIQDQVQHERKNQRKLLEKVMSDFDDSFEAICHEVKRLAFGIESSRTRREGSATFVSDSIKMDALKTLAKLRGYDDSNFKSRADKGDEEAKHRNSIKRVLSMVRQRK